MAKMIEEQRNWKLIAIPAALAAILLVGWSAYELTRPVPLVSKMTEACLPSEANGIRSNSASARRNPGNVQVYFDASAGMAGYVSRSPNAIGNLISLTDKFVQGPLYTGVAAKAEFRRFGLYRFDPAQPVAPPAVSDPTEFARPKVYSDGETRIADVLRWILHDRKRNADPSARPLSIVVTDLMLDDRAAIDEFEASVGGLLRNMMLEDRLALGIMAVRVPFEGKIFVGPASFRAAMNDRPLVVLMIGTPYQVRAFYDYLDTSEQQPFAATTAPAARAFALFGLDPGSIALTEPGFTGSRTGFVARPLSLRIPGADGIPTFAFDADEVRNQGGLAISLEANAGVRDFEVIGNEPRSQTSIWKVDPAAFAKNKCDPVTAWQPIGSLPPGGWKKERQKLTYSLNADNTKLAGLDRPGIYFVQLVAGQQGIVENHPAPAWMTDWSMDNAVLAARLRASRGAAGTGVGGLESLRRILLADRPKDQAIRRSASQFIIEIK